MILSGCNTGSSAGSSRIQPSNIKPSNTKEITEFSLNGVKGKINDNAISVNMPFNTDITNLVAKFVTTGKKVSVNGIQQISGTTSNNFTNPLVYLITAEDKSVNDYLVTVTVAKKTDKKITEFSLNGVTGIINGNDISVDMPIFGTKVTNLVAKFVTTGKTVSVDGVQQISEKTSNDFTNHLDYLVTAEDGSTSKYTVKVGVPQTLFTCIPDNSVSPADTCGCLKMNDGSGLIWYADATKIGSWEDWCSDEGPNADIRCGIDAPLLLSFNQENHCGYNDWHLPTVTNCRNEIPVDQTGGEWGTLGIYAKNNGVANPKEFIGWLNNTDGSHAHFKGVARFAYWSTVSMDDNGNVCCIYTTLGYEFPAESPGMIILVRGGGRN